MTGSFDIDIRLALAAVLGLVAVVWLAGHMAASGTPNDE